MINESNSVAPPVTMAVNFSIAFSRADHASCPGSRNSFAIVSHSRARSLSASQVARSGLGNCKQIGKRWHEENAGRWAGWRTRVKPGRSARGRCCCYFAQAYHVAACRSSPAASRAATHGSSPYASRGLSPSAWTRRAIPNGPISDGSPRWRGGWSRWRVQLVICDVAHLVEPVIEQFHVGGANLSLPEIIPKLAAHVLV